MSAKKAGKHTTPPKKRARFPGVEAALAGRPLVEAAAEPPARDAAPIEGGAGMTIPEPDQAEPAPGATELAGLSEGATATGPATGGDATPTEPTRSGPATAYGAAPAVEAPGSEALPEMVEEAPAAQATAEPPTVEGVGTEATPEGTTPDAPAPGAAGTAPGSPGTGKKGRKPRATKAKGGGDGGEARKLSALDAAARVLGEARQAMGCKEVIAAMAAKGYWSSPAGRTPEATLYSALLRELTAKGEQARFVKASRGQFALRTSD